MTSAHLGVDIVFNDKYCVTGFLDSGAANCVMTKTLADVIGLKYEPCSEGYVGVDSSDSKCVGLATTSVRFASSAGAPKLRMTIRIIPSTTYLFLVG